MVRKVEHTLAINNVETTNVPQNEFYSYLRAFLYFFLATSKFCALNCAFPIALIFSATSTTESIYNRNDRFHHGLDV